MKKCLLCLSFGLLSLFTTARGADLQPTPIADGMRQVVTTMGQNSWRLKAEPGDFDFSSSETANEGRKKKSVFRAGLYSAILPGAGEYYLGYKSRARVFFAADVLTWIGFTSFRVYSGWKRDDFVRLAEVGAGARLENKDDEFHNLVGFFDDIDAANTAGRINNPERPFLPDTPDNHWRWVNPQDRQAYRDLKNRSRESARRANFMIGVAIVNRLVSVVDAVITARRDERKIGDEFSRGELKQPAYTIGIDPLSYNRQLSLTYFTDL